MSHKHHRHHKPTDAEKLVLGVKILVGIIACLLSVALSVWVICEVEGSDKGGNESLTAFDKLRIVSIVEMPAQAVQIVQSAGVSRRKETINAVLDSAASLGHPGVIPYVVSALCRQFPDDMETTLHKAIDLQPPFILVYAWAAVDHWPSKVEQISYILGKKSPRLAPVIAGSLAEHTTDREAIIRGLKRGIPEFDPDIHFDLTLDPSLKDPAHSADVEPVRDHPNSDK